MNLENMIESSKRGAKLFLDLPPDVCLDVANQSATSRDLAAGLMRLLGDLGCVLNQPQVGLILHFIEVAYTYGYLEKSAEITDPTPPQP